MVEEDKNKKGNKKEFNGGDMLKEKTVILIKEKFIIFVIGFLTGAIIATSGCIIYNKITIKNNPPTAIQNNSNDNELSGMNDQRHKENRPNMNGEIPNDNRQKNNRNKNDKNQTAKPGENNNNNTNQ